MQDHPPHPNESLLHSFYDAFSHGNWRTMGDAYSDSARFSDPIFPDLAAPQARAMWRMLLERGSDLELSYGGISADEHRGAARWEAVYTFSATGRKVHNVIESAFVFEEGRIVQHTDQFDFWRWTRMALGLKGTLLGWTPLVRNKVQSMAARQLQRAQQG